jgi:hypothetical protein
MLFFEDGFSCINYFKISVFTFDMLARNYAINAIAQPQKPSYIAFLLALIKVKAGGWFHNLFTIKIMNYGKVS